MQDLWEMCALGMWGSLLLPGETMTAITHMVGFVPLEKIRNIKLNYRIKYKEML